MGMSLSEIEERAEGLARSLYTTSSRGEACLLSMQLQGLKDLAVIKAAAEQRSEWDVSVGMRERELAAMESVASKIPTPLAVCESRSNGGHEQCALPQGHSGRHQTADAAPLSWPA